MGFIEFGRKINKNMSYGLEKYNLTKLHSIGKSLGLRQRRSKKDMIADITSAFSEYEEYKRDKIDKYERLSQLGEKGKEGTTYLVKNTKTGEKQAMKTFKKSKSSTTLKKEYRLQRRAGKAGIAPQVHDIDIVSKYIVMDKMDKHLLDALRGEQKGVLYKYQQKRIFEIFQTLDNIGVFHGDANLNNYMLKGKVIYLIDYGFSKEITNKLKSKLKTDHPNAEIMLLGFILKLKERKLPEDSYKYLSSKLPKETRQKFQL